MNQEAGIVWTTRVVVWSFCALLLWLFVVAVSGVFGLKVAGKHLTEGFVYGLPLLLGAMGGGLMLNVILNLNKIGQHVALRNAAAQAGGTPTASGLPRRWLVGVPLVLLFLIAVLFGGDHYTRVKKERFLLQDAQASAQAFSADINALAVLPWGDDLLVNSKTLMELIGKQNKQFPAVSLLIQETVQGRPAVLELGHHYYSNDGKPHTGESHKIRFVRALSTDEAQYMQAVFAGQTTAHRYSAHDGNYELFFPIQWGDKRKAVLYFSQHMRYGKGGS